MYIFHLFRTFAPLRNPIGFGVADFIELALTALLVLLALGSRSRIEAWALKLSERTGWCMLVLAVLPIVLRLALVPQSPLPSPGVSDDFSYLLLADTIRHFRFANPPLPYSQFFETFFVLQQPTYSSIFPLGQGLAIAFGWTLFGHPWAGVAISVGALCALCYWMLRAWTTPGWAFIGGLGAAIEFGPLNQWMNSYWGGAVSACAGCLVFGALPRLRGDQPRRAAALLGLGLGIQLLSRPYETIFVALSVLLYFVPALHRPAELRRLVMLAPVAVLTALPSVGLMLLQNRAVTGSLMSMPYMLSRYQYGVPTTFTIQPNPRPHRQLTREQELDYEAQSAVHGEATDTWVRFWERWASRVRFYRFFLLPALYLALPFFFLLLREYQFLWVLLSILVFSLGTNIYPYFYSHYVAALACLFILLSVKGVERLGRVEIRGVACGQDAARIILFLCAAHFLFWYGLHASRDEELLATMSQYETWDAINHGDPEGRSAINRRLSQMQGTQLVFVRYWPQHTFDEWVHNLVDLDDMSVIWVRDFGDAENQKLMRYYPDRTAWLLEPDFHPPRLAPYQAAPNR
jgi:hypothetical protein